MTDTPNTQGGERQTLINLIAGLSLADHMGDAYEDCTRALKLIGVEVPPQDGDDHWHALARFLATQHGAVTVWGTKLLLDEGETP